MRPQSRLHRGPVRAAPVLAAAAFLLLAAPDATADGFSCGNRVVSEGMAAIEVEAVCGEPDEVTRNVVLRRPVVWRHGRPWYFGNGYVEVPIETWIYNFGPNRLMRKLRFEDGVLRDIETLGYGHHD